MVKHTFVYIRRSWFLTFLVKHAALHALVRVKILFRKDLSGGMAYLAAMLDSGHMIFT